MFWQYISYLTLAFVFLLLVPDYSFAVTSGVAVFLFADEFFSTVVLGAFLVAVDKDADEEVVEFILSELSNSDSAFAAVFFFDLAANDLDFSFLDYALSNILKLDVYPLI